MEGDPSGPRGAHARLGLRARPRPLPGQQGGVWRVLARVADAEGRANETELRVWVAGGRVPPRRDLEQETVTLVPDRKEYRAGDVARLLVVAPFAPAEGVLTLRRSGLLREDRFEISSGSHTLEVPIEEAFTPNVHVQVDLVGQAPRDGASASAATATPSRPAFASGTLDLPVPPASRTLALRVTPREPALEPGAETVLEDENPERTLSISDALRLLHRRGELDVQSVQWCGPLHRSYRMSKTSP